MRRLVGALAIAVLVSDGVQARAAVEPFTGLLGIQIGNLPAVAVGGAGFATVNGSGPGSHVNTLSLPGSQFATAGLVLPVTDPVAAPIKGFELTLHNGGGAFGGAPFGGAMPINGVAKVCLFSPCISGPPANLIVPLTLLGSGGSATVATLVNITAIGAPWTVGTASVGTVTITGFKHGAASLTSSTVGANGGSIKLVTPIFVSTNISASAVVPVFGILDLTFVPEPGTLLLLGSGIAGLIMTGRKRARRSS